MLSYLIIDAYLSHKNIILSNHISFPDLKLILTETFAITSDRKISWYTYQSPDSRLSEHGRRCPKNSQRPFRLSDYRYRDETRKGMNADGTGKVFDGLWCLGYVEGRLYNFPWGRSGWAIRGWAGGASEKEERNGGRGGRGRSACFPGGEVVPRSSASPSTQPSSDNRLLSFQFA